MGFWGNGVYEEPGRLGGTPPSTVTYRNTHYPPRSAYLGDTQISFGRTILVMITSRSISLSRDGIFSNSLNQFCTTVRVDILSPATGLRWINRGLPSIRIIIPFNRVIGEILDKLPLHTVAVVEVGSFVMGM